MKNVCLTKIRAVFKSFSVFPSNFCYCSPSFSTVSFPNTPCTHFQTSLVLHFLSKSSRKGMGLVFLISFSLFHRCFSCHLDWYCVRNIPLFVWWVWLVMFVVDFICFHADWSQCAFSLFWYLPVVDSEIFLLNRFGIYVTCSFHLFVCSSWLAVLVYCVLW